MYTVEYDYIEQVSQNNFIFEHEAKNFAIDIAYEGFNPVIRENGKTIGKIETIGNCKAFIYI
jgi:hypothetical protein